eukprot:m51a1_g10692 hypothetical protein (733) ;mRNA; r:134042-137262
MSAPPASSPAPAPQDAPAPSTSPTAVPSASSPAPPGPAPAPEPAPPASSASRTAGAPGAARDESGILPATYRNLTDRLYEKRKLGALEIELLVKEAAAARNDEGVRRVVRALTEELAASTLPNFKKGGMIALAATAIALGADLTRYIPLVAPPVLRCFSDPDPRVRYYALESFYNIVKVARENILVLFNEIFDACCKLSADPDQGVRNANQLLDRLVKDVVTQGGTFDVERFMPLLQKRLDATNPNARHFLISWLSVLDSVPDFDLVKHLSRFLDGLFEYISDPSRDIVAETTTLLAELLKEVREHKKNDYEALVDILVKRCNKPAQGTPAVQGLQQQQRVLSDPSELTLLTALQWVNDVVDSSQEALLPYSAKLLDAVLPHLASALAPIESAAMCANAKLLALVQNTKQQAPITGYVEAAMQMFKTTQIAPRLAALSWLLMLHLKNPEDLYPFLDGLFPVLLRTLSDPSEEVMKLDLELMAKLAASDHYFAKLMENLARLFSTDRQVLRDRAAKITRLLCRFIDAERIYTSLASVLETEEDTEFAGELVQTLNLMLLSAAETRAMRLRLQKKQAQELFVRLYRAWAHSPASVFSLCLLCQEYAHAEKLVHKFAELDVTLGFLMEMDQLVQLLESPVFVSLRLQLLEPEKHVSLYKALYGVLMLLPQSTAYQLLKHRLNCASKIALLRLLPADTTKSKDKDKQKIDFDALLQHFGELQEKREHHALQKSSGK